MKWPMLFVGSLAVGATLGVALLVGGFSAKAKVPPTQGTLYLFVTPQAYDTLPGQCGIPNQPVGGSRDFQVWTRDLGGWQLFTTMKLPVGQSSKINIPYRGVPVEVMVRDARFTFGLGPGEPGPDGTVPCEAYMTLTKRNLADELPPGTKFRDDGNGR